MEVVTRVRARAEDVGEVVLVEHLLGEQRLGERFEQLALLFEERARLGADGVDDALHLAVDELGGGLGVGLVEEGLVLLAREVERKVADLLAHPVVHHHRVGEVGDAFEVVLRAGGDSAEDDLLGHAPAHRHDHAVHERLGGVEVALLGERLGVAEGGQPARHDGDLDDGVGVLAEPPGDGVAGLVVGDNPLLVGRDELVLLLQPADDAVDGALEVHHLDGVLVLTRGEEGGLVADVGDLGPREARRLPGQQVHVDLGCERELLGVDAEDLGALAAVGPVDEDLAVEAAGAKERGVEDVRTVGGRHDDDALVRVEPVHLDEQLVERVLALVVAADDGAAPAAPADGVDLVDEDDTGRLLLRLAEQVAHARGADADEHLDEVGAGEGEERDTRLAGDGLRQQRLAGARRADEEHALGQLAAQLGELLRVLEEVDDLLDLLLGLVEAGHVLERELLAVHRLEERGLVLPDVEHLLTGPAHPPEDEDPEQRDQAEEEQQVEQPAEPGVGVLRLELDGREAPVLARGVDLGEELGEVVVARLGGGEATAGLVRALLAEGARHFCRPNLAVRDGFGRIAPLHVHVVGDGDCLDVALAHLLQEGGVVHLVAAAGQEERLQRQQPEQEKDDEVEPAEREAGPLAAGLLVAGAGVEEVALVIRHRTGNGSGTTGETYAGTPRRAAAARSSR